MSVFMTWQVLAAIYFVLIGILWKRIAEQNRQQRKFYDICFCEIALLAVFVATVHRRDDPLSPLLLVTIMIAVIILFLIAWRKLSQRPGPSNLFCWIMTSLTVGFGLCLELMLAASIVANHLPDGSETPLYDWLMAISTATLVGGLVVAITVPGVTKIIQGARQRRPR